MAGEGSTKLAQGKATAAPTTKPIAEPNPKITAVIDLDSSDDSNDNDPELEARIRKLEERLRKAEARRQRDRERYLE
jgi:hypothetical protein